MINVAKADKALGARSLSAKSRTGNRIAPETRARTMGTKNFWGGFQTCDQSEECDNGEIDAIEVHP